MSIRCRYGPEPRSEAAWKRKPFFPPLYLGMCGTMGQSRRIQRYVRILRSMRWVASAADPQLTLHELQVPYRWPVRAPRRHSSYCSMKAAAAKAHLTNAQFASHRSPGPLSRGVHAKRFLVIKMAGGSC